MDFSPYTPKGLMAVVFCSMALPCLLRPKLVIQLSLSDRLQPTTQAGAERANLLMRCFGAQAMLSGVAIAAGSWTATSHKAWIGAIVPFFVFDAMAWRKGYLTAAGAVGDAIGNVVFVACSALAISRASSKD